MSSVALATAQTNEPGFGWVVSGESTNRSFITAVATDPFDSIYALGNFSGGVQLGWRELTAAGDTDVFVVKYSPDRSVEWAMGGGGNERDAGADIDVDGFGNVFVAGAFRGEMTLAGATLQSAGGSDLFVAKLTTSGAVAWARSIGESQDDGVSCMAAAGDGGVYIGGTQSGRGFWARFGEDGEMVISNSLPSPSTLHSLAVDSTGALFVGGQSDLPFISKHNEDGTVAWSRSDFDRSWARDVAAGQDGHCYVQGGFHAGEGPYDSARFGGAPLRGGGSFLAKLDSGGELQWVKTYGSGAMHFTSGLTIDGTDCLYITGAFHNSPILFDGLTLTNRRYFDAYVAKYDSSGNALWAKAAGGDGDDQGLAIALGRSDRPVIGGAFGDTPDCRKPILTVCS